MMTFPTGAPSAVMSKKTLVVILVSGLVVLRNKYQEHATQRSEFDETQFDCDTASLRRPNYRLGTLQTTMWPGTGKQARLPRVGGGQSGKYRAGLKELRQSQTSSQQQ